LGSNVLANSKLFHRNDFKNGDYAKLINGSHFTINRLAQSTRKCIIGIIETEQTNVTISRRKFLNECGPY